MQISANCNIILKSLIFIPANTDAGAESINSSLKLMQREWLSQAKNMKNSENLKWFEPKLTAGSWGI